MAKRTPGRENSSLIGSARSMGIATLMSRILGLVREQVFAVYFGAGYAMDAFNIAFRIPNLLRDLFAEGAMSAALVPNFVRTKKEQGERRGWRIAGLVFRILFISMSLLALVGILYAEELVAIYASAFREVPGKFELTVAMTKLIFPFFPLVVLAAAFMAVLNSLGKFFMPAFASALFNATTIVVGLVASWMAPSLGFHPIQGMAFGILAGGFVQAFSQLPLLYRKGYRWPKKQVNDPQWYQDPALRRMLFMMIPGTLGLAATQVNILVNSILATQAGEGAVSWLNYAFRLMLFPIGVFGVSLAAATLPRVSERWVDKNYSGVGETIGKALKHVFGINFAASAGLFVLAVPIVQVIFEYGQFQRSDTLHTASALTMFALGLCFYSVVKVLVPACYGMNHTRIPVISSVLSVTLNIVLNIQLVKIYGFWGLALGTSITAIVNAMFLFVAVRFLLLKKHGDLPLMEIFKSFWLNFGIAVVMGVTCHYSLGALNLIESLWIPPGSWFDTSTYGIILTRVIKITVLILEGFVIFFTLSKIFRVSEATEAFEIFVKRVKLR